MDDTRKPLLYILGPVLGAILLLWTINLGVNQLRHTQEEMKQAARQEQLLQAQQPAGEAEPAEPAAEVVTATRTHRDRTGHSLKAWTAEITDAEPITATEVTRNPLETVMISETGAPPKPDPATEPCRADTEWRQARQLTGCLAF